MVKYDVLILYIFKAASAKITMILHDGEWTAFQLVQHDLTHALFVNAFPIAAIGTTTQLFEMGPLKFQQVLTAALTEHFGDDQT